MLKNSLFWRLWKPTPEQFLQESEGIAKEVPAEEGMVAASAKTDEHMLGIAGRDRWQAWRDLVRIYGESEAELKILNRCRAKALQARSMKLSATQLASFLNRFDSLAPDAREIDGLVSAIDDRRNQCIEVQKKVRSVQPRVLVIHAFLMLSDISGLEVATLFAGGLLLLGAVYMTGLYEAAVQSTVHAYWTLDDLINHGILVLIPVVVALIVIEVLFSILKLFTWLLADKGNAFFAHWFVLKHPFYLILPSFAFMALVAWSSGEFRGSNKKDEFMKLTPAEAELATVMDGTILRDVYLVGTTSRTATFLQVTAWGTRMPGRTGEDGLPPCRKQQTPVQGGGSPPGKPMQTPPSQDSCVLDKQVLIMDRALIACHAVGLACLNQDRRDQNTGGEAVDGMAKELKSLTTELGTLSTSVEKLPKLEDVTSELKKTSDVMDAHLNRHLELIKTRVDTQDEYWNERIQEKPGDDAS